MNLNNIRIEKVNLTYNDISEMLLYPIDNVKYKAFNKYFLNSNLFCMQLSHNLACNLGPGTQCLQESGQTLLLSARLFYRA